MITALSSRSKCTTRTYAQTAHRLVVKTTSTMQVTSHRCVVTNVVYNLSSSTTSDNNLRMTLPSVLHTSNVGGESNSRLWALLCASVFVATSAACDTTNQKTLDGVAMSKMNSSFRTSMTNGKYFHRVEAERAISTHISSDPTRILVLFGARNLGKASVLEHVLSQKAPDGTHRRGVIVVRLDTAKGIDREVAKAFGGSPDSLWDSRAFVSKMCEQFYAEHHYRPVIVFTTTGNTKIVGNDALVLASAIREFSCETHAAVCIANLHDMETAQSFPRDGRSRFVNVPELTKEQTESFLGESLVAELQQRGVTVDQIMDGLGGNPTLLKELKFTEDPVAYLRGTVQQASTELQEAVEKHPEHAAGLVALSKAPFETGLSLRDYSAAAGRALTARDLSSVNKNVAYYDFESKTVRFRTRSLHAAQILLRGWFS